MCDETPALQPYLVPLGRPVIVISPENVVQGYHAPQVQLRIGLGGDVAVKKGPARRKHGFSGF